MKKPKRSEIRATALYDLMVASPDGITQDEMAKSLRTGLPQVRQAINLLRNSLALSDEINLVCGVNPADTNGRWLYKIVGTHEEIKWWADYRLKDIAERIGTTAGVARSILNGVSDKRTREGRLLTMAVSDLDSAKEVLEKITT